MVTSTAEESAALAINHGCDLNCGSTYLYVQKACEDGLVSEEKITEAAARLFTSRYLLGLFDETEFDQLSYLEVESGEHLGSGRKSGGRELCFTEKQRNPSFEKRKASHDRHHRPMRTAGKR